MFYSTAYFNYSFSISIVKNRNYIRENARCSIIILFILHLLNKKIIINKVNSASHYYYIYVSGYRL